MSVLPTTEPECLKGVSPDVEVSIEARMRDLGEGLLVRRLLPSRARRAVGPFIFFDHLGPAVFAPGSVADIRPHPHIGLATLTYVFEGEMVHRDSLGSVQPIRPGEINWMAAGRGIVHSERTPPELRASGFRLHALQVWVALPAPRQEDEPAFFHIGAEEIPEIAGRGVRLRVLAGAAYGKTSPLLIPSPLFYVDVEMAAGSALPLIEGPEERAAYVASGTIRCGAEAAGAGKMLVFASGARGEIIADSESRLVLFGGAPLDGPRHLLWNFASTSQARLEQAARDWKEGRFPKIPGDETEFVPFPEP